MQRRSIFSFLPRSVTVWSQGRKQRTAVLDAEGKRQLSDAASRLAKAEQELTLAMDALKVPEQGAEDVMLGERMRAALNELGAARQVLAVVVAAVR